MSSKKVIIIDPGHGLGNRKRGVYDPGAAAAGVTEAGIVMDWADELREILQARGYRVVRTRIDERDAAPVGERAGLARAYGGQVMLSLHCNAAAGSARGTECFYRGSIHRPTAAALSATVAASMSTIDRGAKLEASSQHARLAVMAFQPCFLLEIGFIDHPLERVKMLTPSIRRGACSGIAEILQRVVD